MPAHLYTTSAAIVEAGGAISAWTPSRVTRLIQNVSAAIDRAVGGRRFIPYQETIELDGNETARLSRPDRLPIMSISALSVAEARSHRRGRAFEGDFPGYASPLYANSYMGESPNTAPASGEYHLRPSVWARTIELSTGLWAGGTANVSVTGVFGYHDPSSIKDVSTTLASGITLGATLTVTLALTSAAGLAPRDVLIITDGTASIAVIVQSISTNNVVVDMPAGLYGGTSGAAATVKSWGAVPPDIEEVATILCKRKVARDVASAGGLAVDPSLLRRLKTDGGEYEVFAPSGSTSEGSSGLFGIPEVDEVLDFYRNDCGAAA